jgi:hypothetical protein
VLKPWLGLAAATMLVACELTPQGQQPEGTPDSQTTSAPPDEAVSVVSRPEAKPKPPPIPPPPPKPSMEPQALVGLGEEEITRMLGEPREVRNDPPAMVWNYVVNECRLDLFFYLDLKSQDFRALAYNFEPNTTTDGAKKACLARIQEANRDRRR